MFTRRHTILAIPPLILRADKHPKDLRKNKANSEADNSCLEPRIVTRGIFPVFLG